MALRANSDPAPRKIPGFPIFSSRRINFMFECKIKVISEIFQSENGNVALLTTKNKILTKCSHSCFPARSVLKLLDPPKVLGATHVV